MVREHAGEVGTDAAAGDVRERVHVDPAPEVAQRGRVDHARPHELLAERMVGALPSRFVEPAAGPFEQRPARQRVAVAAKTRTRETDDAVAGTHGRGQQTRALHHAYREADEVELARLHDVGVLRHLTAEQRAPRGATPMGDTGDDLVDDLGHELAHRDVVEEEQRLRALHRDVVDRHRDQVDADRVEPAGGARHLRLGAHTVGGRHEERLAHLRPVEREEPPEAADVTDDLGSERGTDVSLDDLDGPLAGGDVDAGPRVGEWVAGAVVARRHRARRPSGVSSNDTSTSTALRVTASRSGTGYSPEKHAVQNDEPGAPVAATSRPRSR